MPNKEIKILPCPICGKRPIIYRDISYEMSGFGAWCTIQCKPFLGRPHIKVEEGKSTWKRACMYAIERWNELSEREKIDYIKSGKGLPPIKEGQK